MLYEWAERGALDMCGFTILGVDRGFFIREVVWAFYDIYVLLYNSYFFYLTRSSAFVGVGMCWRERAPRGLAILSIVQIC